MKARIFWVLLLAMLSVTAKVYAQYLGVTCGYQYSAQLTGPLTYPNQFNISLYNPQPNNPQANFTESHTRFRGLWKCEISKMVDAHS